MKPIQNLRKDLGLQLGVATGFLLACFFTLVLLFLQSLPPEQLANYSLIRTLALFAGLSFVVAIYGVKLVAKLLINRPLNKITRVLQQLEKGDMAARVDSNSIDELGILSRRLNKMLLKLSELERIRLHSDRKLVIAEEELKYNKVLEEKTRIIEETNNRLKNALREYSLLSRVSNTLSSVLDPNELYLILSEVISRELMIAEFAIFVTDHRKKNFTLSASHGLESLEVVGQSKVKLQEPLLTEIMKKPEPLLIRNSSMVPEYLAGHEFIFPERCCLFVSILRKDKLLGILYFSRPVKDGFNLNEKELLVTLSSQVAVALENANLFSQAKELTITDDLTNIYNRRYFYQALTMEVKRSKRFKRPLSLLMVDVDYFKKFNDSFGHLVGDQVLKDLAAVLSKNIREVDTLARYGGEEFAIILLDTEVYNAYQIADKIRNIIEEHFKDAKMGQQNVGKITISVGVSGMPADAITMDDLLNHADIALYSAKIKGRNQVVVYNRKVKPALKAV